MKYKKDILMAFLITTLKKPLLVGLLIILIDLLLYEVFNEFYTNMYFIVKNIRFVSFVLLGFWYFLGVISLLSNYLKKENGYKADYSVMLVFLKILLIIIVLLIVLKNFGVDVTGVLAFGGVSGVVAGLAAREFLANMFGFIAIVMDRTFKVGDNISSPDKKISGLVESIGLRCTKITTYEKKPIYVPNALFSTIIIQNDSNVCTWSISERIALSCLDTSVLVSIISEIRSYFVQNQFVNKSFDIGCNLDSIGSGFFIILVHVFVNALKRMEYLKIRAIILLKISDIVSDFGGKIILYNILDKLVEDAGLPYRSEKTEE